MNEITRNTHEMEWQEAHQFPPGAYVKVLREGEESKAWTILLKLPSDWMMNTHTHIETEEHYVLEGEYEMNGRSFPAGSYRLIPQWTPHGPLISGSGAVILVSWDPVATDPWRLK